MENETIGSRLKEVRQKLKYSQAVFSKKLGISQQNYSLFEKDKRAPNLRTLKYLFNDFNVNLNWLIMGLGKMNRDFKENVDLYKERTEKLKDLVGEMNKLFKDVK